MEKQDKEIWKQITSLKGLTSKNYAISTHGRFASFNKNINDLMILKPHLNSGFPMIKVNVDKKSKGIFAHNAIGEVFLKKHSSKCKSVIHLDHDKANNHVSNLKWATPDEKKDHVKKSPLVIQAIERRVYTGGGMAKKLDEKKVIQLKKEIWNPKRKFTLKQLAAKYGIAEMNLYRIKSGELWFHVHVEGEPIFPKYKAQLKNIEFHEKLKEKEAIVLQKKKQALAARLKVFAENRRKKEVEKKLRQELLLKKRKQKAAERILIEKRKALRAKLAEKRKKEVTTKAKLVKKNSIKKTEFKSKTKSVNFQKRKR